MNQILVVTCLMSVMMWVGVGTIWIYSRLLKNPKIPFAFNWKMIPEIMYFPTLTFLGIGLISFFFGFLFSPNETKDCLGLICKITRADKFHNAVKFAVVFGLIAEYVVSLALALKCFVVVKK